MCEISVGTSKRVSQSIINFMIDDLGKECSVGRVLRWQLGNSIHMQSLSNEAPGLQKKCAAIFRKGEAGKLSACNAALAILQEAAPSNEIILLEL